MMTFFGILWKWWKCDGSAMVVVENLEIALGNALNIFCGSGGSGVFNFSRVYVYNMTSYNFTFFSSIISKHHYHHYHWAVYRQFVHYHRTTTELPPLPQNSKKFHHK